MLGKIKNVNKEKIGTVKKVKYENKQAVKS